MKLAAPVPGASREPTGEGRGGVFGKPAMMSDKKARELINDCYVKLRDIQVKRPRGEKPTHLVNHARIMLLEALELIPGDTDEAGVHST